jgi:hypothetical protein
MKKQNFIIAPGLILLFTLLAGFANMPQEVKKNIDAKKAKTVKTEITFPAGKLYINPDGKSFCEGFYKYKKDFWEPNISYYEESENGYLKIDVDDERREKNYNDDDENEWTIAFNKEVKNDLHIEMIAGESNIDLQDCNLSKFRFEMVAGETNINLRNTSVPFFEFRAIAGEAEIDLSGTWKNDLDAEIKGGVGELTIKLPADVGVKVSITGGLGDVSAHGFNKNNRVYTNDLYGKTKESLYVDVTGGIGNVTLRLDD